MGQINSTRRKEQKQFILNVMYLLEYVEALIAKQAPSWKNRGPQHKNANNLLCYLI